jgi:hypothetical protein
VKRDEGRRRRELERLAKEQAKLSTLEQARLEVETYENRLSVLRSIHKEQSASWDWDEISVSLAPLPPARTSFNEFKSRCALALKPADNSENRVQDGLITDERLYQEALQAHHTAKAEWETLKTLARQILAGECQSHIRALETINPFDEIADLGSALHFIAHDATVMECSLKVNGIQAVPSEIKALTSTGKLSVRAMPRAQFHEVYQDHICSCVLRVAREIFAVLPVQTCLITALADWLDSSTGRTSEQPVLSVAFAREEIARMNFERLDPSDAIDNVFHRGDFKASRKSGAFAPIIPLTPADLPKPDKAVADIAGILQLAHRMHQGIKAELAKLQTESSLGERTV